MKNKLFFWFGVFLLADSIWSLYVGNFHYQEFISNFSSMSNSVLGNLVRLIRGGIGIILILKS